MPYNRLDLMLHALRPVIETSSIIRNYSSGATILYQGEVPRSVCILVKGAVRVFSITEQGEEQIVMYHLAGELFPVSWIFAKSPGAMFFYEATEDCEIALTPRQELMTFLTADVTRLQLLLDYFATNYSASLIRINALEQSKARDKLVYTLYYLCKRHGKARGTKTYIPLTLTHQNLASLVGLTRETTATEMNKLKQQKILSYDSQQYLIDEKKLLELVNEDSFRGIRIGS